MLFINYRTQRRRALPCPFAVSTGVGLPAILPAGPDKPPSGGRQGHFCRQLPGAAPAVQYGRQRAAARYFVQASASRFMPSLVCFQHTTARCGTSYRISSFRKNFILLSGKFYLLASLWYNKAVILRQHRTIPALRLKHRFGGCGTASALPKCSIMSGCGTRIVLRGQKPLALCDRCPCFGSLFPPLAALTFAASSIICAFGLASAAPRSPYRHLELCGIALKTQKGHF